MSSPLPSTGTTWSASPASVFQWNRVRRGGRVQVLIRDYGGASTNLSPAVFGGPFAQDGQIRSDLFAMIPSPSQPGVWIPNPTTNQGFYLLGSLDPKGVDFNPDLTVDKLESLQSYETVRSDIQKEMSSLSFTAIESTPVIDVLDFNLPLSSMLTAGQAGYFLGKPAEANLVERQIMVIRADVSAGLPEYTGRAFPRVTVDKIGKRTWDKKTADAFDVTFDRLLDEWFVNTSGQPITTGLWRSGSGWEASGGTPAFSSTAPVATAVTGAKATIVVAEPTDPNPQGVTYTVQQQVGGTGPFTNSTLQTGTNPSGVGTGTLTFTVTTLTPTSTYKFQITALGNNNESSVSPVSNSITATS